MARKTTEDVCKNVAEAAVLALDTALFAPGDRVCVAASGGADSTALLRTLLARREELGIVLSVVHVEHGLRGQASDEDAVFVRALAEQFDLACEVVRVDTRQRMSEHKESVETAARALRYQAFRDVLATGKADKVATAHTLNDQAETVLMKLLRGAWTEGLSGIHPELRMESGGGKAGDNGHTRGNVCVRPFLRVRRTQIEDYLREIGQPWRQDASNDSLAHTRNRIRHELLPHLREFNPQIDSILAHMADNARSEEQHWQAELDRLLPLLLLPGKPTRGGGRSVSTSNGPAELAIETARLLELDPGLLRRVLRAAAEQAGATLDFDATERLLAFAMPEAHSSAKRVRLELSGGISVERSARELRFGRSSVKAVSEDCTYELPVPGISGRAGVPRQIYGKLAPGFIFTGHVRAVAMRADSCMEARRPGGIAALPWPQKSEGNSEPNADFGGRSGGLASRRMGGKDHLDAGRDCGKWAKSWKVRRRAPGACHGQLPRSAKARSNGNS